MLIVKIKKACKLCEYFVCNHRHHGLLKISILIYLVIIHVNKVALPMVCAMYMYACICIYIYIYVYTYTYVNIFRKKELIDPP
jgi:hypothetical protein